MLGVPPQARGATPGQDRSPSGPTVGSSSIRTGGPGATIEVKVSPARAQQVPIRWTTDSLLVALSGTEGDCIVVTGHQRDRVRSGPGRHRHGAERLPHHGPRLRRTTPTRLRRVPETTYD